MLLTATLTNAITNGLHAFFLFLYFLGALIHYLKKDGTFSLMVTLVFFVLFILKLLGVYVHYYSEPGVPPAWIAVSLLTIMLNYLIVHAMEMPPLARTGAVFLSILAAFFFFTQGGEFSYIAASVLISYMMCAYYSRAQVRVGFLMVVGANIAWILARQVTNHFLGHEVDVMYRYDNDFYHLLLIISTFVMYKGIVKGDWRYPPDLRP